MTISWKTCDVCNGTGELFIVKNRLHVKRNNKEEPIFNDIPKKCPTCNGKGKVYIQESPPPNPWALPNMDDET